MAFRLSYVVSQAVYPKRSDEKHTQSCDTGTRSTEADATEQPSNEDARVWSSSTGWCSKRRQWNPTAGSAGSIQSCRSGGG